MDGGRDVGLRDGRTDATKEGWKKGRAHGWCRKDIPHKGQGDRRINGCRNVGLTDGSREGGHRDGRRKDGLTEEWTKEG